MVFSRFSFRKLLRFSLVFRAFWFDFKTAHKNQNKSSIDLTELLVNDSWTFKIFIDIFGNFLLKRASIAGSFDWPIMKNFVWNVFDIKRVFWLRSCLEFESEQYSQEFLLEFLQNSLCYFRAGCRSLLRDLILMQSLFANQNGLNSHFFLSPCNELGFEKHN